MPISLVHIIYIPYIPYISYIHKIMMEYERTHPGTSRDNPVHLSDATDASASGSRPRKDDDFDDEAKLLGHFSDTLHEMATSIVDLEDRYFRALHEVIVETERALRDVSRIDAHYVSQIVTVMSSWQEVVQTAASHMEGVDTTIYLAHVMRMHEK